MSKRKLSNLSPAGMNAFVQGILLEALSGGGPGGPGPSTGPPPSKKARAPAAKKPRTPATAKVVQPFDEKAAFERTREKLGAFFKTFFNWERKAFCVSSGDIAEQGGKIIDKVERYLAKHAFAPRIPPATAAMECLITCRVMYEFSGGLCDVAWECGFNDMDENMARVFKAAPPLDDDKYSYFVLINKYFTEFGGGFPDTLAAIECARKEAKPEEEKKDE